MCCIFTSNPKLPLLFQADPTKVETVQDVLERAAAKGLLGGIIPEQSKTGKKGKSRKNRTASARSKHSCPSSPEGQTGRELLDEQDPTAPLDDEEKKGDFSEEGKKDEKKEDKGGKGGKKRRGLKGCKRKVKGRPKQTSRTITVSKRHSHSHKKKTTKRKGNQSPYKKRLTKSKARKIPRLTLTLISSAKPPSHLSPITALAHKLSGNPSVKSQQSIFSTISPACPAPLTPHAASKQVQRQNIEPERPEETLKDAAAPKNPFKARGKVKLKTAAVTQDTFKPSDFALPPISSPSASCLSSRSHSSPCQRPSWASNSQLPQISTSSSSVSLPGL